MTTTMIATTTTNINTRPFDTLKLVHEDGTEYWSARDLQGALGYVKWQKFEEAIERAKISCEVNGQAVLDHFTGAGKSFFSGPNNLVKREAKDYQLSRYACYLVAMNGDVRKPEIAAAQSYFAIQTYKQEMQAEIVKAPTTLKEALLLALQLEEEKERLAEQNAILAPKAEVYDAFIEAKNYHVVGNVAKVLGYSRNAFFAMLREDKILSSTPGMWNTPLQQYIDRGYFVVKVYPLEGLEKNHVQTYVTASGLEWLSKRYQRPTLINA